MWSADVPDPGGVRRARGAVAWVIAALLLEAAMAPSVHAQDGFSIAGEVDGLYPGAEATLEARVTNPHPFTIRVISTSATVFDASPSCPASMLDIGDSETSVDVPPRGTGTVPLEVRMSLSAPDACQGATWPLEFSGTAVSDGPGALPGTGMISTGGSALLVAIGAAVMVGALIAVGRERRRRARAP
jgi:hypothetical protein